MGLVVSATVKTLNARPWAAAAKTSPGPAKSRSSTPSWTTMATFHLFLVAGGAAFSCAATVVGSRAANHREQTQTRHSVREKPRMVSLQDKPRRCCDPRNYGWAGL